MRDYPYSRRRQISQDGCRELSTRARIARSHCFDTADPSPGSGFDPRHRPGFPSGERYGSRRIPGHDVTPILQDKHPYKAILSSAADTLFRQSGGKSAHAYALRRRTRVPADALSSFHLVLFFLNYLSIALIRTCTSFKPSKLLGNHTKMLGTHSALTWALKRKKARGTSL